MNSPLMPAQPRHLLIPVILLIAGLVLIATGISLGELGQIFLKSTMVCTQCIGIG